MDLIECRERLNGIDDEIVKLFVERCRVIDAVAEVKGKTGAPVRDEARENVILTRLTGMAEAEYAEDVRALYERILELSRARQIAAGVGMTSEKDEPALRAADLNCMEPVLYK